ncbi:MAG: cell wall hydrolase, partial [Geminicoccaceae bacterium]|nr:cell wall hydrolase [Geminicoccaceae bacterium]
MPGRLRPAPVAAPIMAARIVAAPLVAVLLVTWAYGTARAQDAESLRMMALDLYHEARSEGREGMVAVGWVVLNRIADPAYPDDVVAVVTQKKPGQGCEWGWWCDGRPDRPTEADMWALAQDVAADLLGGAPPPDPTGGALWFHETFRDRPAWMGDQVRRTATIGRHHFYARN